jgi:heterodisulfide reductase subunit C
MEEIRKQATRGSSEAEGPDPVAAVRKLIRACIQCGTCTGSCPNAFAMDLTPRMLWSLVLRGEVDEIFESRTFTLCSSCYTCTLRCPRLLPVTEAMAGLKQEAARRRPDLHRRSTAFSRTFMDSVRRHGRVDETEFMLFYFAALKNPLLPVRFSPMGMRLMRRGKIRMPVPWAGANGVLDPLFRTVERLERSP